MGSRFGNEGARGALKSFWEAVACARSIMQSSLLDRLISPGSLDYSPGWILMDTLSRVWSPYQMNPANYHPLREILKELRQGQAIRLREQRLHQSAARVRSPRYLG
jgi:NTE family protein